MISSAFNFYAEWRERSGLVPRLREDTDPPPERLLQVVWFHQRLLRHKLVALDGRRVQVLHPGFWSHEGGPDFRGAIVQLDGEVPIEWSADGRSIYVYRFDYGDRSVKVYRVRVESGERELWKEIVPSDPAGIEFIGPILMTPDASSYVYTYQRRSSDLYVVEGLR